jgi:hypothetical protein
MNAIQFESVLHHDKIRVYNQSTLIDFVVYNLFTYIYIPTCFDITIVHKEVIQ